MNLQKLNPVLDGKVKVFQLNLADAIVFDGDIMVGVAQCNLKRAYSIGKDFNLQTMQAVYPDYEIRHSSVLPGLAILYWDGTRIFSDAVWRK